MRPFILAFALLGIVTGEEDLNTDQSADQNDPKTSIYQSQCSLDDIRDHLFNKLNRLPDDDEVAAAVQDCIDIGDIKNEEAVLRLAAPPRIPIPANKHAGDPKTLILAPSDPNAVLVPVTPSPRPTLMPAPSTPQIIVNPTVDFNRVVGIVPHEEPHIVVPPPAHEVHPLHLRFSGYKQTEGAPIPVDDDVGAAADHQIDLPSSDMAISDNQAAALRKSPEDETDGQADTSQSFQDLVSHALMNASASQVPFNDVQGIIGMSAAEAFDGNAEQGTQSAPQSAETHRYPDIKPNEFIFPAVTPAPYEVITLPPRPTGIPVLTSTILVPTTQPAGNRFVGTLSPSDPPARNPYELGSYLIHHPAKPRQRHHSESNDQAESPPDMKAEDAAVPGQVREEANDLEVMPVDEQRAVESGQATPVELKDPASLETVHEGEPKKQEEAKVTPESAPKVEQTRSRVPNVIRWNSIAASTLPKAPNGFRAWAGSRGQPSAGVRSAPSFRPWNF